ncbi:major capsid protein [Yersinia phage vB_YenM_P778]
MSLTNSAESRFLLSDLTGVVNTLPNQYGFINSLNLFSVRPQTQTTFLLDLTKTDISLLDPVSRAGHKAESQASEVVSQIAFPLITFKDVESIVPEELQGVRQAGTVATPETEARLRAVKLAKVRSRFDITKEFLKMQALKGKVKDANGKLWLDMYAQFGVAKAAPFEFMLDDPSFDIDGKIEELKRHMEDNAGFGTLINGEDIIVLVDAKFFNAFTNHAKIRDAYLAQQNPLAWQQMTASLRTGGSDGVQQNMNMFRYRGLTLIQYNGKFKNNAGVDQILVKVDQAVSGGNTLVGSGHAFPNQTMVPDNDLFQMAYAPCAKMGYANTAGQELYVFEYERDRDEGIDFEAHSILMPFCTRPQLLVDLAYVTKP